MTLLAQHSIQSSNRSRTSRRQGIGTRGPARLRRVASAPCLRALARILRTMSVPLDSHARRVTTLARVIRSAHVFGDGARAAVEPDNRCPHGGTQCFEITPSDMRADGGFARRQMRTLREAHPQRVEVYSPQPGKHGTQLNVKATILASALPNIPVEDG